MFIYIYIYFFVFDVRLYIPNSKSFYTIANMFSFNFQNTCNVRGIYLHMCELTNSISLEPTTFTNMHNLRYLKIYDSCCPRHCKADYCKLNFPYGLDFPLKEVRYLHWEKFPLKEIPSNFKTENLVDLRLPYSNIKRVWEGIKVCIHVLSSVL